LVTKVLTDITGYEAQVLKLRNVIAPHPSEPIEPESPSLESEYSLDMAMSELFRPRADLERLIALLRHKKNLILSGPPGVGKTFIAKRLAYLIMGVRDPSRTTMIQFHQSMSYEDFVQGFRPNSEGGFDLRPGPFLEFCNLARQAKGDAYVFIIDEINRGNLSKIFGELMMLMEADKRGPEWEVQLAYSANDEKFHIPPNVYLVGTMNTADRSIALVDYALRRRFAFYELTPRLDDPGFGASLREAGASESLILRIRNNVRSVNQAIATDAQLGSGYLIGHSYFTPSSPKDPADDAWYERIVEYELAPLLREYFFDQAKVVEDLIANLRA